MKEILYHLGLEERYRHYRTEKSGNGRVVQPYNVPLLEAFAATLARMAYPRRLDRELRQMLQVNWSPSKLSTAVNTVLRCVNDVHYDRVTFNDKYMKNMDLLGSCAEAVSDAGLDIAGAHPMCIMDGVHVPVPRTAGAYSEQEEMFDGHHHVRLCSQTIHVAFDLPACFRHTA